MDNQIDQLKTPASSITIKVPYYDNKHFPTILTLKLLRLRGIPIIKLSGHVSPQLQRSIKHLFEEYKIHNKTKAKTIYTKIFIHISNPLGYEISYNTRLLQIIHNLLYEPNNISALKESLRLTIKTIEYYFGVRDSSGNAATLDQLIQPTTGQYINIITNRYTLTAEFRQKILTMVKLPDQSSIPYRQSLDILKSMLSGHLYIRYLDSTQQYPTLQLQRIKPLYEEFIKLKIKHSILQYRVTPEEVELYSNMVLHYPLMITLLPPCKCGQYLLNSNCICSRNQRRQYLYNIIAPILEIQLTANPHTKVILLKRRRKKLISYEIPAKRIFGLYL